MRPDHVCFYPLTPEQRHHLTQSHRQSSNGRKHGRCRPRAQCRLDSLIPSMGPRRRRLAHYGQRDGRPHRHDGCWRRGIGKCPIFASLSALGTSSPTRRRPSVGAAQSPREANATEFRPSHRGPFGRGLECGLLVQTVCLAASLERGTNRGHHCALRQQCPIGRTSWF